MLAECADELTCDMAETYGVLEMRTLPARLLATLSCGLSEDSRVMRRLTGRRATTGQLLQAAAVDRLSLLVWAKTKDGQRGRNRPQSLVEALSRKEEDAPKKAQGFDSEAAFEAARRAFLEG